MRSRKLQDQLDVAWQNGRSQGRIEGMAEGRKAALAEREADLRLRKAEALMKLVDALCRQVTGIASILDNAHGVLQ